LIIRTCVFSGIQFKSISSNSSVYKTNEVVHSNSVVILTRQTCSQRSSRVAGSKRRALALYSSIRIGYVFLVSKCRGESDLGLCITSVLEKRIRLGSADSRSTKVLGSKFGRKSALPSRILFASTKVLHRPRSDSLLHFDTTHQIRTGR